MATGSDGTEDITVEPARMDSAILEAGWSERFVAAWRYIVGLMREEGASNLVWVWHPDSGDNPDFSGIASKIITRVTTSSTGWASVVMAITPRWTGGAGVLSPSDGQILRARSKAGAWETAHRGGVRTNRGNPRQSASEWARQRSIDDLFGGRWPRVVGFSWWNERWENDDNAKHNTTMRLQDNKSWRRSSSKVVQRAHGHKPHPVSALDKNTGMFRPRRRPSLRPESYDL
jgi:hypothetical protein